LHARDIVHRDLKQENILLIKTGSDKLKLADFALSKTVLATGAFLKSCIRIPYYFALEVLSHN
jgi:serine/threonine-protein kinase ULK/ATG1